MVSSPEGSLLWLLWVAYANLAAASHFWPQVCAVLGFLGTVWLTASLPFALANILFAARSARLAGQPPPRGGAHGYRQAFIPSFMLALPLALFPWPVLGVLLGRATRALPWPSNPFLVAASLILVALVVGTVLYWTLYEARARRELAALLAEEVMLEDTREDHSICPILERRVKDLLDEHVLMIDQDGITLELEPQYQWRYFFRLVPYFAPRDKTAFERDIDRKLAAVPEDARVIVFVHGGLSDFRPNLPRAYARYKAMKADDARLHPIFVMWRSGLLPCYGAHVWHVRQGRQAARWLLKVWTVPATLIADVGRGLTRLPMTWYYQIITDLKPITPAANPDEYSWTRLYTELRERYGDDPACNLHISLGEDTRPQDALARVGRTAAYFNAWTFGVSFAVWPLVDAFGKSAWDVMLRRTRTLFRSPYEYDLYLVNRSSRLPGYFREAERRIELLMQQVGNTLNAAPSMRKLGAATRERPRVTLSAKVPSDIKHASKKERARKLLDSPPTGALFEFFEHYQKRPTRHPLTLVGHSMGSIVLNRLLEHFPDLECENLVYLAAACSIRDCVEQVVPYLEAHAGTNLYNLTLHPRAEQGEYHVADFSPRGSLLEWIDSYFSLPLTHDDRTFGKWENVLQATHLFPRRVKRQVHIKGFGVGPSAHGEFPEGNPQMHGDFSGEAFWREAFWRPHKSL